MMAKPGRPPPAAAAGRSGEAMDRARLTQLHEQYRAALLDDVVPFWERHGVDRECGGFFTCLDRTGQVYGTDKPVWIMGRATWLYATLYRTVEPRPDWLALARHGYEFLTRYCFDPRGKMYFLVTRDGRPLRMRRYYFSEVFGVLALTALARATGDDLIRRRAVGLFQTLVRALRTPGVIEPKVDPRTRPLKALSPLMCLLNVADTLRQLDDAPAYERLIDECVEEIFRDFVKDEDGSVLETVGPRGERLDEPDGRTMNPGHAIECAWFILDIARRRGDAALAQRTLRIVDYALERGWDRTYGGLLYFVDVAGRPPTQLEHDLKLWWPHCEALVAVLMAWRMTGTEQYARWFERLHDYTFAHFPDPEYGEWYGYLHRDGTVSTPLKGNLWKGPFHIPRALLYCERLLAEALG